MAASIAAAVPSFLPSFRTRRLHLSPLFPLSLSTRPFTPHPTKFPPLLFSSCNAFSPPPPPPPIKSLPPPKPHPLPHPLTLLRDTLLSVLVSLSFCASAAAAVAAAGDSIRASGFGLMVAATLRRSGWADDAIVFALATLPVLELRGAIPVGYWLHLHPLRLTLLSVVGNMVPVPLIVLYLKPLAVLLSRRSASATRLLRLLLEKAREKAAPVEEFRWLGLMLFVAVPFPGTGAWTGAIIAALLDMPFWSAVSANFVGVVLAGLLVNLLVNLGLKYAVGVGLVLFLVSTVMWSVLRHFKKALDSK